MRLHSRRRSRPVGIVVEGGRNCDPVFHKRVRSLGFHSLALEGPIASLSRTFGAIDVDPAFHGSFKSRSKAY